MENDMVTVTTKDYSPRLEPRQDPEEAGREAEEAKCEGEEGIKWRQFP